jgi:hypothetical protein
MVSSLASFAVRNQFHAENIQLFFNLRKFLTDQCNRLKFVPRDPSVLDIALLSILRINQDYRSRESSQADTEHRLLASCKVVVLFLALLPDSSLRFYKFLFCHAVKLPGESDHCQMCTISGISEKRERNHANSRSQSGPRSCTPSIAWLQNPQYHYTISFWVWVKN